MVAETDKCPIWDTDADLKIRPDADLVDSPRAGGKYLITGTARAMLGQLSKRDRAKLTTWLVDQRRAGNACPEIDSDTIRRAKSFPSLTVEERRDRFLLCLERLSGDDISAAFRVGGVQDAKTKAFRSTLAAWTESVTNREVSALISFLMAAGLISNDGTTLRITFAGWQFLYAVRQRVTPYVQAFVAMWFDPLMEAAYREGFEPAIIESGYKPLRIDKKEHINKIDDEIIAEIKRSRFVVADFTSEPDRPRGGVYFEAGFAMGLKLPVVWTCRKDLVEQVHFDTRQFNQIAWETPPELREKLRTRILAILGQGPLVAEAAS